VNRWRKKKRREDLERMSFRDLLPRRGGREGRDEKEDTGLYQRKYRRKGLEPSHESSPFQTRRDVVDWG